MATSKGVLYLNEALRSLSLSSHTCRAATSLPILSASKFTRPISSQAPLTPTIGISPPTEPRQETTTTNYWRPVPTVPLTIFEFPSFEPWRLESWSSEHLHLPLRRDILHLAVVYEGDNTRQGTASSKTRFDVAGSHRKIRPQKGSGNARLGTRQSPMLRGGGKVFGPKPRDFGTKMTRKAYDLAWRTALSYRYRRGELIVCRDGMDLPLPPQFAALVAAGQLDDELQTSFRSKWARQVLDTNDWGRQAGRSTFITTTRRDDLFDSLSHVPTSGRALEVDDVDVKDLLETGRLVVERAALREMLERHQSDLVKKVFTSAETVSMTPECGVVLVE
ncbi:ribosomal protein L4 [Durotheca rogersii]|uniref:ribosomal protein L4 n=1 Tax=Durotheca rogersii TaxID=419775 RepID=UPI002220A648|nr:ribosomal protein L4 [Durotheca rogersii]KAI5865491.1 ribosomal protein L4 [Durotheca rogersii]